MKESPEHFFERSYLQCDGSMLVWKSRKMRNSPLKKKGNYTPELWDSQTVENYLGYLK